MSALPISIGQFFEAPISKMDFVPAPQLQVLASAAYLSNGSGLIRTYNTAGWTYLATDINNEFAVFESDEDWCLALINLRTGEWFCDEDPLFPALAYEEDAQGEYILDHRDMSKLYLSTACRS